MYVSGMPATDGSDGFVGVGDVRAQTSQALSNVKVTLEAVRAGSAEVVPGSSCWISTTGEGRRGAQRVIWRYPYCASMVEVRRFIWPEILVEIEADFLICQDHASRPDTRGT
jgi:hypothetical protein